jgi:iron complex transport system ATP-binding protein
MSVIALKDIRFVRDEKTILDRVCWTIRPGEHWAMLGPNGSGKTSLLKIVTGYEWPSEGEVSVLGKTFGRCNLPQLRKSIGWVSSTLDRDVPKSDTAINIVASGIEASLGLYRDFSKTEFARARKLMAGLNCLHVANQQFHTLSQGERQRVLITRALINRPKILILDEPCASLDPATRDRFLTDLAKLSRHPNAPAMVFVTHHIEEIGTWINRVMVIKDGRTLASGKTADVLTDAVLSHAFGCPCEVEMHNQRYYLRMVAAIND